MLFLIALILAFAFACFCGKPLKQHPYIFYAAAAVITVIVSAVTFRGLPELVNTYILGLFSRGALGTAFWAVVMWAGALPNGSKPIKKLMPIRGELSIFAAILTLGHNIGYGRTYFVRLFTDAGRMSDAQLTASILTIAMLVIMIPLTVMSFPQIRKKMNAKLWKKIQRTAYLFYAMIYLHIMVLFMPMAKMSRPGYFLSVVIYSIVFIGYAVCRIRKWYLIRRKPESARNLNIICSAAFVILLAVPCVFGGISSAPDNAVRKDTVITMESPTEAEETTAVATETPTSTAVSSSAVTSVTTTETATEPTETEETSEAVENTETEAVTEAVSENTEEAVTVEETVPVTEAPTDPPPTTEAPTEPPATEPPTEPEPVYIYNNGTFSGTAYGYDGDIKVSVTIENDVITSITGVTYESDPWYYDSASAYVIPQIIAGQNTQVDAYSGATYSSDAIMTAVANALNKARK